MTMSAETSLRFVPSAVEGLPEVTEITVYPDRLELRSAGKRVVIRFLDIARGIGAAGSTCRWLDLV